MATRTRLGAAVLIAVLAVSSACSFGAPPPDSGGSPPNLPTPSGGQSSATEQSLVTTVLVKNLAVPWAIGFLPDGSALVTERDTRRILKVGPQTGPDGLGLTPVV